MVVLLIMVTVIPLALYYSVIDYLLHREDIVEKINTQLYTVATFAEAMLPEDYHDRIIDSNSVTKVEFDRIVERNNRLCEELELQYIWSLMLLDGHPYFTTSTSPDKKVENGLHAKFFEPHTNPEAYTAAFAAMEPQFIEIDDKWGSIHSVLIPRYDSHGRKHLFGASIKMSVFKDVMLTLAKHTLLVTIAFMLPSLLIGLFISKRLTVQISRMAATAKETAASGVSPPRIIFEKSNGFTWVYRKTGSRSSESTTPPGKT